MPYLSIIDWKIRQITYVLTQNRITHIHHLDGIKHMLTINICLFENDIVMIIVERFFTWEDNISSYQCMMIDINVKWSKSFCSIGSELSFIWCIVLCFVLQFALFCKYCIVIFLRFRIILCFVLSVFCFDHTGYVLLIMPMLYCCWFLL